MLALFPGALKRTFLAPALICLPAPASSKNTPVHSNTTSTPNSFHGKFSGISFSGAGHLSTIRFFHPL